jgi:hypothetical protein
MAEAVYLLCAITSALCATLLLRSYRQTGGRLLLWSGLCFVGLTVNNVLLFVDLIVVPSVDLSVLRRSVAVIAMSMLLFGLLWEAREP